MTQLKTPALLLVLVLTTAGSFAQQKTGLHIIKKYPVGSPGGWDYVTVDASEKKIYVSHATKVIIMSTVTGDSIGVIPNTNGVHGIALAKPFGKGYTSNGRDNACTIFDLKTSKVIGTVAVGTNPDAIFYDDFSKKVYCFNGRSNDASVIDPATDKVVATIPLGGKPETGVSDGKGNIYVNSETTNEVVVIDAHTYQVTHRYKIDDGDEPSGLAIDVNTKRLFIGCGGNKTAVIMDATNGKNLAKFPIGDCDGVAFDPELKLAYTSNGGGTISIIKEISANKFELFETITTEPSARTIGIDVLTHHLFLPAAKTEPNPAGGRPKQVPGTFHVIEIGK
jgi:YVTN family beta-propeller protein